jgi:N-acetylmuramoyl-L-alanine amidase
MKKKAIPLLQFVAFFLLFVAVTYTLARVFYRWNQEDFSSDDVSVQSQPVVILDAGHGGMDGGAVSASGIKEKDINLAVVQYLDEMLRECGITTILTRSDDRMLTLESGGKKKMQDLRARLNIANENQNAIFVSVHMNNFTQSKYSGLQVYYSPNHADSELLAELVQNTAKTHLQKENERLCKEATSSIFLLHRMKNPAVLVECGFLSNEAEAAKLATKAYQKQLAFVICASLLQHYNHMAQAPT